MSLYPPILPARNPAGSDIIAPRKPCEDPKKPTIVKLRCKSLETKGSKAIIPVRMPSFKKWRENKTYKN